MKIEIQHVKKNYNDFEAVHDLSFSVEDGELMAFLGPSGCGKTTLLRMIAGLIPVTSGKILFDGRDVTTLPVQKRNTAMVFQNYALFPNMTVSENVAFGLKIRKLNKKEREKKVKAILEKVHLLEYYDRRIQELSGGQRQRVALARALVLEPDILLFDEPLSNLDQKLRVSMRQIIRQLQKEYKITCLYVTHDQEEAMSISDSIAVMDSGVIQQIDTPQNLYFHPKNAFVSDFIGKTNLFHLSKQKGDGVITFLEKQISVPVEAIDRDQVIISIRPENIRIQKLALGVEARVRYREVLGLITRYHIETTDNKEILVDMMSNEENEIYQDGEKIELIFDEGAMNVFID